MRFFHLSWKATWIQTSNESCSWLATNPWCTPPLAQSRLESKRVHHEHFASTMDIYRRTMSCLSPNVRNDNAKKCPHTMSARTNPHMSHHAQCWDESVTLYHLLSVCDSWGIWLSPCAYLWLLSSKTTKQTMVEVALQWPFSTKFNQHSMLKYLLDIMKLYQFLMDDGPSI